jgi:hypothetical protein
MPWLSQVAFDKFTKGGVIVAIFSMMIFVGIDLMFGRYESIAADEAGFDSQADGKLVNLYFAAGLCALAATLGAAHFLMQSFPPTP